MTATPRLILGSSSPRRLAILKQIGITPDVVAAPDINEDPHKGELPRPYSLRIALEKNAALAIQYQNDFIVTADTTCAVGRRIFGKPEDLADAERMIRVLSGRAHRIFTGTTVRAPDGRIAHRISDNRIIVKRLSDDEIKWFLDTNEWEGKAGGYMFQGAFARFIKQAHGSTTGIIGLPAYETIQMLTGLGWQG